MKKRLFAGLIASAMMASMLAGCGGSSGSNGNAQGGDKASGDGYSMTLIMSLRDGPALLRSAHIPDTPRYFWQSGIRIS